MAELLKNDWLSRLQGNSPTYASFILAALIIVELARMAVSALSVPVKSPEPVAIRSGAAPARRAGLDVQSVVSAHLFGIATADPTVQDPDHAPLSSSNLMLAGTIATQNPKRGVAIISDGGPSKVYSIGDNVNGATLHSVYLDHVILDRAGILETLQLPRLQISGRNGGAPPRRGGVPPQIASVQNLKRMVEQDPGLLDQVMRTVPSYDNVAGKLRGFRAYPGKNRAIFGKLGLKPGDLVTAINGQPLDDPQHSQDVFNTIQSSERATVTVERAGQKQDITLNIAQVATQATKELESEQAEPASTPGTGAATLPPSELPPAPNSTSEIP